VRIGHYEVHDELARGGMGVVYRATDARSGAQVVLKLLKVDNAPARRRLGREARAMRRLAHPNVVTLYDSGEHQGQPYLVLPYVSGGTLQDRLDRDGALPTAEATSVAIQIGEGLRATHALGLLHRDVKPDNVLLDQGFAKLTDFGLAKDVSSERSHGASLTLRGGVLGTPGFWPREQALGKVDEVGPPADVYALGATLYAMLSGRPPRNTRTLAQALTSFNDPVDSLSPHIPRWLDELVLRCLANDPQARPTVDEVLATLERSAPLAPPEPAASPPSVPARALHLGSLILGLALGASLGVGGTLLATRDDPVPTRAPTGAAAPLPEPPLTPQEQPPEPPAVAVVPSVHDRELCKFQAAVYRTPLRFPTSLLAGAGGTEHFAEIEMALHELDEKQALDAVASLLNRPEPWATRLALRTLLRLGRVAKCATVLDELRNPERLFATFSAEDALRSILRMPSDLDPSSEFFTVQGGCWLKRGDAIRVVGESYGPQRTTTLLERNSTRLPRSFRVTSRVGVSELAPGDGAGLVLAATTSDTYWVCYVRREGEAAELRLRVGSITKGLPDVVTASKLELCETVDLTVVRRGKELLVRANDDAEFTGEAPLGLSEGHSGYFRLGFSPVQFGPLVRKAQ